MKIAIPVATERVEVPNYYLNVAYMDYVARSGFEPILVTPYNITEYDGLLLPGGIDVDPIYYGYDNNTSRSTDPEKDKFERDLLLSYSVAKKPIFGICRGFQLIFLEFCKAFPNSNLTYTQHVDGHNQNELKIARLQPSHFVDLKDEQIAVNSMHHQACLIKQKLTSVDDRIFPIATTDRDAPKNYLIIEEFAIPEWNVVAVQWHPEEMKDSEYLLNQHFGRTK